MGGNGARYANLAADVARDSRWFPSSYDEAIDEWTFTHTDNAALAAEPFLDTRCNSWGLPQARVKTDALAETFAPSEKPALNVIWHTGFCCSTLIARALNADGLCLSLCEPLALSRVSHTFRNADDMAAQRRVRMVLHLLRRTPQPVSAVTIKPAPFANVLLPDVARATQGKMLFLYSDCRSFLISLIKLGEQGRSYIKEMFAALVADTRARGQQLPSLSKALSDLEGAALLWHMQIAQLRSGWAGLEPGRAASLDCDAFLTDIQTSVAKIGEFLDLPLDGDHVEALAKTGFFERNAKAEQSVLDAPARRKEHDAVEAKLVGELNRVVGWSYDLFPDTPLGAPLADPLLTIEKAYRP